MGTRKKAKMGRPTIITPDVIHKLEEAFAHGATDLEACFYAGIGKSAFYNYQEANPDFAERKEGLKGQLALIAKNVIAKKIKSGDTTDAKWYLERKSPEFSTKTKTELQALDKNGEPTDPTVIHRIVIDDNSRD